MWTWKNTTVHTNRGTQSKQSKTGGPECKVADDNKNLTVNNVNVTGKKMADIRKADPTSDYPGEKRMLKRVSAINLTIKQ